ncbi:MAG: ATP-binding cassette domain-containing protein [Phycisphaerales bacterium]|nr:ATP-binding cassette domain-containing protein [Phycisphaerales bacterium]
MQDYTVVAQNVTVYQNNVLILKDINFTVDRGEFVYLVGRTGTGKSSLLKLMYGELPLYEGSLSVAGFDLAQLTKKQIPYLRRNLGMVFQDFQLLTDRNVYENLRFVLRATGWHNEHEIEAKIMDVLTKVSLTHKVSTMTFELSGGEQQRVDIARALLNSPKLILADEPTGNLDPESSGEIMQLLFQVANDFGTSVIMATHDFFVINSHPSRIIKIEDGTMIDKKLVKK